MCILVCVLGLCTEGLLFRQLKGTAPYCYVTALLDDNGGAQCDAETELIIKQTSATLYAGMSFLSSLSGYSFDIYSFSRGGFYELTHLVLCAHHDPLSGNPEKSAR